MGKPHKNPRKRPYILESSQCEEKHYSAPSMWSSAEVLQRFCAQQILFCTVPCTGAPVYNNTNSLTVGARGPVLIEDYNLVEKNAQLNRERIPERVVHARGTSAKGYFEVSSSSGW